MPRGLSARCATQQYQVRNVRFGSKADMGVHFCDVRFTPQSGHSRAGPNDAWLVRLATGRNYCVAPSASGECRTKAIEPETCRLRRRSAVTVQAMGYFWVGTSKLDDWTSFATGQLGLQRVDRGGAVHAFRIDDRKQRMIVDGSLPEGDRFFGWEVADAAALNALATRLENAGVAVRRESDGVADQRCAAEVISFHDPAGNRVEAFHGGQIADEPFRPARHIGGFRTGTQGVGHAVLMMPDI